MIWSGGTTTTSIPSTVLITNATVTSSSTSTTSIYNARTSLYLAQQLAAANQQLAQQQAAYNNLVGMAYGLAAGNVAPPQQRALPPLGFNPFMNASDQVEAFIRYCDSLNLTEAEVLALPLQTFIMWLLVESAQADGEEAPEAARLPALIGAQPKPRCPSCGRWLARARHAKGLGFCNAEHYARFEARAA